MRPAFGSLWIISQLSRYPREVVKMENPKKIEKGNKKKKKEFVFSSLGQNMRLHFLYE